MNGSVVYRPSLYAYQDVWITKSCSIFCFPLGYCLFKLGTCRIVTLFLFKIVHNNLLTTNRPTGKYREYQLSYRYHADFNKTFLGVPVHQNKRPK